MGFLKEKKLQLLLFILLGLITAISLFILFNPPTNTEKFESKIDLIDQRLANGDYAAAFKQINNATRYVHEYKYWLKLLKRSYKVAQAKEDYEYFYKISRKAVYELRGNEECWAFYISSMLWTGRVEEAAKKLSYLESDEYDSLKGEILLILENRVLSGNKDIKNSRGLIEELNKRRDPFLYEKVGLLSGNDYLLFNAALLWLREGDALRGHNLISQLNHHNPSIIASALISYDAANFKDAVNFLLTDKYSVSPENTMTSLEKDMLLGDCYYLQTPNDDKGEKIQKAIDQYSGLEEILGLEDWRIFSNLSQFYNRKGSLKKGYHYASAALKSFPYSEDVLTHFVTNYYDTHPLISEQAVDIYLQKDPGSAVVQLLKMKYFPGEYTTEQYTAFLWKLFNSHPSNQEISRFFLWYLLGRGDYSSAQILLSRLENEGVKDSWIVLYKAVLMYLQGDPLLAEEDFAQFSYDESSWFSNYNFALISMYNKKINRSLELLELSFENLQGDRALISENEFNEYGALIQSYRFVLYESKGMYEKATAAREKALLLNPSHPRVQSLLSNM